MVSLNTSNWDWAIQHRKKEEQERIENIFTSPRVPGTYLRAPKVTRESKIRDFVGRGLEYFGVGGSKADKIAQFATGMTPARALDRLDAGDPTEALESIVGGPSTAMFVGPMARGVDQLALKEARALSRTSLSPKDIWRDTGWFKGRDEKWRTEISDEKSRLHGSKAAGMEGEAWSPVPGHWSGLSQDQLNPDILSDVFTHDRLYDAYPEIANYGVLEMDPVSASGGYMGSFGKTNPKLAAMVDGGLPDRSLTLNTGGAGVTPVVNPRRTMLHELQHAVQAIEKFDPGSSPVDVERMAKMGSLQRSSVKPFWQRAIAEGYDRPTAMKKAFHDIYNKNAGEAEANLAADRSDMTSHSRLRNFPLDDMSDFDTQWAYYRDMNDMLRGGSGR